MLRSALTSTLLLAISLGACVAGDPQTGGEQLGVVNGTPVVGYPSAGALQRSYEGATPGMICTGTLIGCDTFMTAAHCVCDELDGEPCGLPTAAEDLSVFFQHGGVYQVVSSAPHPAFDFPDNDIAILRLDRPVVGIRPAPLLRSNPAIDAQLTIVGFGNTFKNSGDDGIKREGLLQRTGCSNQSDDLMLCYDGEDSPSVSCNGDSGGPNYLNVEGYQHVAGIVSGGGSSESCAVRQKFATLVPAFLDYIEQEGGELGQEQCGDVPGVEDPRSSVTVGEGDDTWVYHQVEVPPGAAELRIGANARRGDHVRIGLVHEREVDYIVDDCGGEGRMSAYCSVNSPEPGIWNVVVTSDTEHQVAMTTLSGAPGAVTDLYDALSGQPLKIKAEGGLLINDQARRERALRAEATVPPRHGTVEVTEDGSFVYESEPGYIGIDSFSYRVHEDPYSAEARVFVEVREEYLGDCGCQSSSKNGASSLGLILLGLVLGLRRRSS